MVKQLFPEHFLAAVSELHQTLMITLSEHLGQGVQEWTI